MERTCLQPRIGGAEAPQAIRTPVLSRGDGAVAIPEPRSMTRNHMVAIPGAGAVPAGVTGSWPRRVQERKWLGSPSKEPWWSRVMRPAVRRDGLNNEKRCGFAT